MPSSELETAASAEAPAPRGQAVITSSAGFHDWLAAQDVSATLTSWAASQSWNPAEEVITAWPRGAGASAEAAVSSSDEGICSLYVIYVARAVDKPRKGWDSSQR